MGHAAYAEIFYGILLNEEDSKSIDDNYKEFMNRLTEIDPKVQSVRYGNLCVDEASGSGLALKASYFSADEYSPSEKMNLVVQQNWNESLLLACNKLGFNSYTDKDIGWQLVVSYG